MNDRHLAFVSLPHDTPVATLAQKWAEIDGNPKESFRFMLNIHAELMEEKLPEKLLEKLARIFVYYCEEIHSPEEITRAENEFAARQ